MEFRDTFGGMEGINKIKNEKESKKIFQGAGEMAQWQRALAVIAEDLGSTPSTLMVTQPAVRLLPGDSKPSSTF